MIRRITDIAIPEILYKYRDWNDLNHRRLISHQEIYLPKPSTFNDPFDGNIPVRWDLLTYEECHEKNLEIINILNRGKDQRLLKKFAKKATDEKVLWHPDKLAKESPEQLDKWDAVSGISSLSSIADNILMWSQCSSNRTGFFVGFDSASNYTDYVVDY